MVVKPQRTKFQVLLIEYISTLSEWSVNPWRKYSIALIIFFLGYFFGSSLGMISAVFELMDPVAALVSLLVIESLIKIRRYLLNSQNNKFLILLADFLRYGLFYGFFTEGLKLL
tara:strand:+ start:838 stop:1179 length:342 start_codon:yes stop_codon:yes gene_type:complete